MKKKVAKKSSDDNALDWISGRIEALKHPMETRAKCKCGEQEVRIVTNSYEYCKCGGIIRYLNM